MKLARTASVSGVLHLKLRPSITSKITLRPLRLHTAKMSTEQPPQLSHILETVLYVRDLEVASKFYKDAFNVNPVVEIPKVLSGFSIGNTTLLLFKIGATDRDRKSDRGIIPKHGPTQEMASSLLAAQRGENPGLRQHYCFSAGDPEAVDKWDAHLQKLGIEITARMDWEKGGKSIYFEDPDGHVGEIGSRGIWPHY